MNIILNNNSEHIDVEKITLAELIILKKFTFKMLVTKVNGKLVKTDERAVSEIVDGDDVQIIHLISGG